VYYQLFDENGLTDADGTAGAINLLDSLGNLMFDGNGVFELSGASLENVLTIVDNDDQQLPTDDPTVSIFSVGTDGGSIPAGYIPVTFIETTSASGVFVNTDESNKANIVVKPSAPNGQSATATYDTISNTILVASSNTAPVANDDVFTTQFETNLLNLNVLANDTDADFDPLTIIAISPPINGGTAVLNATNNGINYTPDTGFRGVDIFGYDIFDGTDVAFANVTIPVLGTNGKIAFTSSRDGNNEIYTMNSDGTGQTRLTNHPESDFQPMFSPDGTKIVFASNQDTGGPPEIYIMNSDGTGQTRLTNNIFGDLHPSFSPDGTKIVFLSNRDGPIDIYTMDVDGTNVTRLTDSIVSSTLSWSPDGTKIAFTSIRDGNAEIYMMNSDGTDQTRLTNDAGSSSFQPFHLMAQRSHLSMEQ
jgi:hypothetical protein